ncbi:FecR family protein [Steroidobacter sp.]|uniref:FecR family protein n=1 Tax=Steroidobacter sp. TaxID=1978227 RepID=UPI001A547A52|nr:FecR domain-containing protein [Steroidobacter sp.]MBL8268741.1 FecR domain-containing protein [Steroidobacter sp.]
MNDHDATERDAAEWFLAIQSAQDPDPETLQAWLRWLEASEQNRQAFEEIAQVWNTTPYAVMAKPATAIADEDYDASIPIAEWLANSQVATAGAVVSSKRLWLRPLLAVAASLAFVAVGWVSYRALAPIQQGEFVTGTGEQRQLKLADGSHITLGAHSRLSVDLTETRRQVHLQAGEAYFSVHKDPRRPFVVEAMKSTITAVGTAFNVRAIEDRLTVTVSEGRVKVANLPEPAIDAPVPESIGMLGRGQQLTYTHGISQGELAIIKPVDTHDSARWREGWLIYRDEPLKYVIADIARYTDLNVEVTAIAAEAHFSGAVSKDGIAEWVAALPDVIAVSVTPTEAGFRISER